MSHGALGPAVVARMAEIAVPGGWLAAMQAEPVLVAPPANFKTAALLPSYGLCNRGEAKHAAKFRTGRITEYGYHLLKTAASATEIG